MRCFCVLVWAIILMPCKTYSQDSNADEVAKLKARVELLEAQLKAVTLERDALKEELESASDESSKNRKDPAPLGTIWKGTLTDQNGGGGGCEYSVISRDGKKLTLLSKAEQGAMWEYDCELTSASKFKIVSVRRLKANEGIVNPPPVGNISGSGSIGNKKLVVQILWKENKLAMKFVGDIQDQVVEKK